MLKSMFVVLVAVTLTAVAACNSSAESTPTYATDVAPLVAKNCVGCHQNGEIAPFPLTTYEEIVSKAQLIREAVTSRIMPPWRADNSGACQKHRDAKWLSDEEISRFVSWIDGDMPRGNGSTAPLVAPTPHLAAGEGTLDLRMGEAYTATGTAEHPSDDYHCFMLDGVTDGDRFVTGIEVLPGNRSIVHHVLVAAIEDEDSEKKAQSRDDAAPGPGWSCFGGMNSGSKSRLLGVWAPGTGHVRYPSDTGLKVSKGRRFAMQVHYNLGASTGSNVDQTGVRLQLATTVAKEALLAPLSSDKFTLPPNQPTNLITKNFAMALLGVPAIEVHGVLPHMHTRGKTIRYEASDGDTSTCLVDVRNWDFHWQWNYLFERPVTVTASSTVSLHCDFDTSGEREPIKTGEGTGDEMCLVFSYVTLPNGGPLSFMK